MPLRSSSLQENISWTQYSHAVSRERVLFVHSSRRCYPTDNASWTQYKQYQSNRFWSSILLRGVILKKIRAEHV